MRSRWIVTVGASIVAALLADLVCAVMLWRHREGGSNRRSVWICSRNDAIGNIAVVAAALGVFAAGTAWPDIAVAVTLAGIGISGARQIVSRAHAGLSGIGAGAQAPLNLRQTGIAHRR